MFTSNWMTRARSPRRNMVAMVALRGCRRSVVASRLLTWLIRPRVSLEHCIRVAVGLGVCQTRFSVARIRCAKMVVVEVQVAFAKLLIS